MSNGYFISGRNGKSGGSSGEFDGTITWGNVNNKPQVFPPSEHDHDERYYTKDEVASHVNSVRNLMEQGQGKVRTIDGDELGYLEAKIDNATIVIEDNELKVKTLDGLSVGVVELNELQGVNGNVQSQLDSLGTSIANVVSGMQYTGFEETYDELTQRQNVSHGDFVFVLNDEDKGNVRSIRIFNADEGKWDYIGPLTASTKFTEMEDTPSNYQNEKYLKSTDSGIVYDDVDYQALKNKPQSTATQIDDAVKKKHEHSNKDNLDGIGESANGVLTYKGEEYVKKSDIVIPQKQYVYGRLGSDAPANTNWTIRWERIVGNIAITDGTFILEKDKVYDVTVDIALEGITGWNQIRLIDTATREEPPEAPNIAVFRSIKENFDAKDNGTLSLIIKPTSTRRFGIVFYDRFSGSATPTIKGTRCVLKITEL